MRHLRIARELLPQADIRVLRHREGGATPEYANGLFHDIKQALAFSPNVAVICNPSSMHLKAAMPLAEAGTHLFIEKPLSASSAGVQTLIQVCRRNAVTLFTGYNLRFLKSLQQFYNLIREGAIGQVMSVRCEAGQYLPSWRPDIDYRQGVSSRQDLGGGVLLELSHEIDYIRWIFGEIDWVSATLTRQSSLDIDTEDTAHLTLGFSPGQNDHQLIGSLNLDFVRQDACRVCTAIGERGSLRWNGVTGLIEQFDANATDWREISHHQHQRDESYRAEWGHFLECVGGGEHPSIPGEDGLKVLQIIDAARQAALSGTRVLIDRTPEQSI